MTRSSQIKTEQITAILRENNQPSTDIRWLARMWGKGTKMILARQGIEIVGIGCMGILPTPSHQSIALIFDVHIIPMLCLTGQPAENFEVFPEIIRQLTAEALKTPSVTSIILQDSNYQHGMSARSAVYRKLGFERDGDTFFSLKNNKS